MTAGLIVGAVFVLLALRKVDFGQMAHAFLSADYYYLIPPVLILFFSLFLRTLLWRCLIAPIRKLDLGSLFTSLIIGYSANVIMPARLGEILRAYVLSKKRNVSASATLATIVMERVIDIFALLAFMVLAVFIHPFPNWLKDSGYILLAGSLGLFAVLIFLKKATAVSETVLGHILRYFPQRVQHRVRDILERFVSGIMPLLHWYDYVSVGFLAVIIWSCYGIIFYFTLHAFGFVGAYNLPWSASLIVLVITSIGIVIPSSPGYMGTYHYLCQISLTMFGVPAGPALSFAVVVHAINFLPVMIVGLMLAYWEGVGIMRVQAQTEEGRRQRQMSHHTERGEVSPLVPPESRRVSDYSVYEHESYPPPPQFKQ